MLTIRLSRIGKKHQPQYRIVVQEKTQDPWAPAKDVVGHYNPLTKPSTITLEEERIKEWLSKGAQPSSTVHNMLVNAGIIKEDKINTITITKKRADKLAEAKKAEEEAKLAAEEAKKAEEEAAKAAAEAEAAAKAAAEAAPAEEAPAAEAAAEEAKTE